MTKNNTETLATLLQRVNMLEEWAALAASRISDLGNSEVQFKVQLTKLHSTLRSVEAQLADLSSCLAAHQMDTFGARIKRLLRRR